jgi:hypothetical protein
MLGDRRLYVSEVLIARLAACEEDSRNSAAVGFLGLRALQLGDYLRLRRCEPPDLQSQLNGKLTEGMEFLEGNGERVDWRADKRVSEITIETTAENTYRGLLRALPREPLTGPLRGSLEATLRNPLGESSRGPFELDLAIADSWEKVSRSEGGVGKAVPQVPLSRIGIVFERSREIIVG